MVRSHFRYVLIIILCQLGIGLSSAQTTVFSEVNVNKTSVFVGEPVEVTIGIYTSTWFTSGVDIGNITINGAFSVYFRSVSIVKKINGKTFAGVQFKYNVFPFENQDLIIPSLTANVETPNEGGYKGIKRQLKTKQKTIKIKPYPPGINPSTWMVTSSLSVNEQWLGNYKNIKVGDVLERKITRRASGTVSELIPPVIWDSIQNISLYPSQSYLDTNKSRTAISATRTDGVRYLFEEEGEVTIPDIEFVWWSAYGNKLYKKTLKGLTISVQSNPDLDMLRTAKAELASASQNEVTESKSKDISILGFTLKQFLVGLLAISFILFILIKLALKFLRFLRTKNLTYHKSEAYAYKKVIKCLKSKDRKLIIPLLYNWISQFNLEEPTLKAFALKSRNPELINEVEQIEKQMKEESTSLVVNKTALSKGRRTFLKTKNSNNIKAWINP